MSENVRETNIGDYVLPEISRSMLDDIELETRIAIFIAKVNEAIVPVVEAFQEISQVFTVASNQLVKNLEPLYPYIEREAKKERSRRRYQRMMERRK